MAETTITGLPTAGSIDATQDWLPIDTTSLNTTQKINRNTFLGITGAPLGTTDTQSPTNKTFDNTNTFTIRDDRFTLQDNADTTKQAVFQLSGITTATTRTYTLPNASSTLADISTAQIFTNKTLTSPAITGGTITNSTISVDSIAEYTAANGVTVDGLNLKDGKLNTNNSVITANITDSAVTPAKLLAGTGTGWIWQSWTPSFTNLSGGTLNYAKYIQVGKAVYFRLKYTLGGAGVAGSVSFSAPVNINTEYNAINNMIGFAAFQDTGTGNFYGFCDVPSANTIRVLISNVSATYQTASATSSTVPFTWAINDVVMADGWYEAA